MIYSVTVKPDSKKGPLVLQEGSNITIYLREKPIDGKANSALIKHLSKHLGVAKTRITIKSGHNGRQKLIEVVQ